MMLCLSGFELYSHWVPLISRKWLQHVNQYNLRCFLCKHNSPLIIIYCLFYVTGRKKGRLLYIAHLRRIYLPKTLPLLTNTKRRTLFLSMKKKGPLFNKVRDGQGSLYGATCSYMAHDSRELLCHEVYNETIIAARSV